MRKKALLMLGVIVMSIFLFIQPIKAESEIVGITASDDVIVSVFYDIDGFFLGGFNHTWSINNPDYDKLIIGYSQETSDESITGFVHQYPYLKFNLPNRTEEITSMDLRLEQLYDNPQINIGHNLTINLVNNNWNEFNLTWSNQPDSMGKSIDLTIFPEYNDGHYVYFDLMEFKDFIENNTLSINMVLDNLEYRVYYASKDSGNLKPTLIVEYTDPTPPTPFILTSNAGNPDRDGIFILQWTDSEYVNTYSIYRNNSLIEFL